MAIPTLDPIEITVTASLPDVSQLTTKSIDGTGVFDILMRVTKLHLLEEYNAGRITGDQYSQMYISAFQAVLQQSNAFLLNHQNEKLIGAQIALTRQQTVTEIANTDDAIPTGLGFNDTAAVEGLVASQLAINALQADLVSAQADTAASENDLVGQKIITELGQTDTSIVVAKAAGYGQNVTDVIDGKMRGDAERSQAEANLTTQKLVTELGQTSTTKPIDLGQTTSTSIDGLVKAQTDLSVSQKTKVDEELVLVAQKAISELAQTSDTVPTDTSALNTSASVTGVVNKQKILYTAQSEGFARDAEQKIARIMVDAWSVDATVGDATANSTNHLADADLGDVILAAKAGIGT